MGKRKRRRNRHHLIGEVKQKMHFRARLYTCVCCIDLYEVINTNSEETHYMVCLSFSEIEALCQELVEQGLLKKAKNVKLQDCLGMTVFVDLCGMFQNVFCCFITITTCKLLLGLLSLHRHSK